MGPSRAHEARGQRLRLSPADGQRRQSGYVVEAWERGHSPSWGRQCSSATTSSGAAAAEERRGRRGSGPSAVARRAQPGGSGSGSARRMDNDDSRGTWSNGDTPPLGAGSARRRPPAAERQRRRNGEGGGAAAPAQWPGGPSPGAAAPAQPGGWTTATVGVRGRTETLPLLEQAVLVGDHQQWSGSGGGTARAARRGGHSRRTAA